MSNPPQVVRPLSHLEKYKASLHLLRQHCGTVVACRYSVPDDYTADIAQEVLNKAIARTVLEHPLMQVSLRDEDSAKPVWGRLKSLDLSKHIFWQGEAGDAALREAVQSQLHAWFEDLANRPGWRICILAGDKKNSSLDVVLCWHHAHFDGMSAKIFHQTLCRNLNDPRCKDEIQGLEAGRLHLGDGLTNFPPPPETLRKIPVSLGFTISTAWKELKPPFLATYNAKHANWAPIRSTPYGTNSCTLRFGDAAVQNVVGACRRNKATLTSLLNALMLVSLAVQLDGNNNQKMERAVELSSVTAMDLRRFMRSQPKDFPWHDPHRTMDNEVTLVEHDFDAAMLERIRKQRNGATSLPDAIPGLTDIVWTVAARIRAEFQVKLDSDLQNDPVGLMDYVKDWRQQMRSKILKPRAYSWGVTNLGVIDGDAAAIKGGGGDPAGWKIERALFRLSAEVAAPAFHISAVSVKGKELCVDVGWQEDILDDSIGENLARDIETWLNHFGTGT